MAILSKYDLRQYREKLQALLDRLSGTTARLESEISVPIGEATVSQGPTEEFLQSNTEGDEEVAQTALLTEEELLAQVRSALARLDRGTFGRCGRCGRRIGKTRLDAVPYARRCIHCAEAESTESD